MIPAQIIHTDSFAKKRLDRVEARGLARRIVAEEHPRRRREQETHEDRGQRNLRRPVRHH
jgi:hypothetical protein